MGIGANRVYCEEQYEQCLLAIGGNPNDDPAALAECNRIAGVCFNAADGNGEYYMNDWSHATFLHFHKTDSEGKTHTFSDYEVGMFIDLFDQGDTGFAVFEITAAPTLDGDVYTIGVTPVQHEGEASGLARIKVFELAGADPTDFVRKTGDTMTGSLNLLADTYDETSVSYPKIIFKAPDAEGEEQFSRIYQKGAYLRSDRSFQSGGSLNATGNLQYNGITRVGMSSGDNYLGVGTTTAKRALVWNSYGHATKIQTSSGYGQVGQALTVGPNQTLEWATPAVAGPASLSWKYQANSGAPVDGTFYYSSSHYNFSYKSYNNIDLGFRKRAKVNEWNRNTDMTIWILIGGNSWEMHDHIELEAARWSHEIGGVKCFQFKRKWRSHGRDPVENGIYYITVGGWF